MKTGVVALELGAGAEHILRDEIDIGHLARKPRHLFGAHHGHVRARLLELAKQRLFGLVDDKTHTRTQDRVRIYETEKRHGSDGESETDGKDHRRHGKQTISTRYHV